MHLIESYATSSGLKIGKPFILESYFPLALEKYICLQPYSKFNSKNYEYWQEVVDLILPHLRENNITIVQIGADKEPILQNCYSVVGQTNIKQVAYIIKNSLMHVGADSFGAHIASGYGKKIVAVYSNNNIANVKPYWTKEEDMILLEPERNGSKPSYSADENPRAINNIKPELIAQSILKTLNIKNKLSLINTIYLGRLFNNKIFHIVPDHVVERTQTVNQGVVRMDLFFDEKNLNQQLKLMPCIISSDRPIDLDILKQNKAAILGVNYFIQDESSASFIKDLKRLNIKYQLYSYLEKDDLNKYKMAYIDEGIIIQVPLKHKEIEEKITLQPNKNIFYKSNNLILSKGQVFLSEKAFFDNKPIKNINENVQEFYDIKIINENPNKFYIFSMDLTKS
jgi:hypothetical protein